MNTAALKTFAPAMRRQLMEAVGRKLDLLLHSQTPDILATYASQIAELRQRETENRAVLLERVAYSWFNRLAALRYLDAKGWHPFGCKVLMPATEGETQPGLLKLMRSGSLPQELKEHCNETRLNGLLDGQIPTAIAGGDPQGEVYRELVLAVCRSYHQLLPNLFEGLDDATELLLPDDLLTDGSIAAGFRSQISDADCEDVEIIGWLYQFYISEKKDQVIGKVVKSEDIPAATQLFTPNWIVKYMVQNSLGAQWLATYPDSAIKGQMEYYIEPAEQTEEVQAQLAAITPDSLNPEELTLIDPACGSGHILVEAYDLFKAIYLERGYQQREIPQLILEKNLFGLEICPRAAQLTSFALMMKGRADDRRLFERGVKLNVMALVDSGDFDAVGLANAVQLADYGLKLADLTELKRLFEQATTFGSLIQVPERLAEKLPALKRLSEASCQDMLVLEALERLRPLVQLAELLAAQYDAVVANPPYMGSKYHVSAIKAFLGELYPAVKSDLFAAFVARSALIGNSTSRIGIMSPNVWMYISTHQKLRDLIASRMTLASLVELPLSGFKGATVQICTFTLWNYRSHGFNGSFVRLVDLKGGDAEMAACTQQAISRRACGRIFICSVDDFKCIPGSPVAYWVSSRLRSAFQLPTKLKNVARPNQALVTGNTERYIRRWQEVDLDNVGFEMKSRQQAIDSGKTWFPYNKGGDFRKWYGNNEHLVNWKNDGEELRTTMHPTGKRIWAHNFVLDFIFRRAIVWSKITSAIPCYRLSDDGFLYDDASGVCQVEAGLEYFLQGFLASQVSLLMIALINPTLNIQPGNLEVLPLTFPPEDVDQVVKDLLSLSRVDWDSFETSWGFHESPLLKHESDCLSLETGWRSWKSESQAVIGRMRELETENNRIFINAYGLHDELTPEVPIEQITIKANPAYRYGGKLSEEEQWSRFRADTMEELLSYAVGCMMGRYSLDKPGLILADSRSSQDEHLAAYQEKMGKPMAYLRFRPDDDAILPVLDGEWFQDDIVARSREFLRVAFPGSNIIDNLRFLEEAIGKDLRKYFCTDFYKSHLQTYKNRPIYWMVQSPKRGFACLIYLHRYTKDTLLLVLNNYFRPYLQKLEARLAQLDLDQANDDLPTRERTAARKEAEKITKVLRECQEWEQDALLPLAQQRIELDLDDGVKVNYLKLQDVLAKIPGIKAKEE
ncbi:Putative Type IIC bifunctional restriction-modification protein with endonuclease and N6-adenine DNA methyltransferase activity [Cyanobium sp. NS01]|nr:Putative Type IIC bifunctional restriction-modification protein with endonuclease and N6-adenine DNA methyltransferase activity [Cyanobium sp. NS01]